MRNRSLILIIFGALSVLTGNTPDLYSKIETLQAKLYTKDTVDICEKSKPYNKEVLLLLDIGAIKPQDSLYGFNYEISYDPEKIRIIQPIYIGTLAEAFEANDMSIDSKNGIARGFATTMQFANPPVSGVLPLIGFLTETKSDCKDSTVVKINYLEFTEEFKKSYDTIYPVSVLTKVKEKADRGAEVKMSIDSISSDSRRVLGKVVVDKNAKIENFKALFSLSDTSFFKFSNIKAIGASDQYDIDLRADKAIIKFKLSQDKDNLIYIDLVKQQKYVGVTSIESEVLLQNDCECLLELQLRDNKLDLPKDSSDTSVSSAAESNSTLKVYSENGRIYVENTGRIKLTLENIKGIKVKESLLEDNMNYLEINDLPNGAYLLRMQTETYKISTRILLISNKQVFFN